VAISNAHVVSDYPPHGAELLKTGRNIDILLSWFQVEHIGASATLDPGLNTAIVHRCTNAGNFCMSPRKSQEVSRPARPSGLQLRSTCRFGISRSGLTSAFSGNEKAL
jgi:hypothetical protein